MAQGGQHHFPVHPHYGFFLLDGLSELFRDGFNPREGCRPPTELEHPLHELLDVIGGKVGHPAGKPQADPGTAPELRALAPGAADGHVGSSHGPPGGHGYALVPLGLSLAAAVDLEQDVVLFDLQVGDLDNLAGGERHAAVGQQATQAFLVHLAGGIHLNRFL